MDIYVKHDKKLCVNCASLGASGDNKASELRFIFPDRIAGIPIGKFRKRIVAQNACGRIKKALPENNTVSITRDMTRCDWLELQLQLSYKDMIWRSEVKMFDLCPSLCACGIDESAEALRDFKMILIDTLNETYGYSFDEYTTAEQILAEIGSGNQAENIKKWFIDQINRAPFGFCLDYDMSYDDLALNISMAFDRLGSTMIDYTGLQSTLKTWYNTFIRSDDSDDIDIQPEWLKHVPAIESHLRMVDGKISELKERLSHITGNDYTNASPLKVLEDAVKWLIPIADILTLRINEHGELIIDENENSPVSFELNNGCLEVQIND